MPSPNVFFIVGSQRSGTTLLSVMLGKHSEIQLDVDSIGFRLVECFGNYKEILPYNLDHSWSELQQWLVDVDYKGRLKKIIKEEDFIACADAKSLVNKGVSNYLKSKSKSVLGDKSPNLQYFTNEVNALLPKAKFIHVVRDGRASALSRSTRANKNLYLAGEEWVDGNITGMHHASILGSSRYLFVKYEDLLVKPEATLNKICSFLDIDFEVNMLENSNVDEAKAYVNSKIDSSRIDSFKNELTNRQIRNLEKNQGPMLRRMGYELLSPPSDRPYKQMSTLQRLYLSQMDNLRRLFRSNIEGMRGRKKIHVKMPIRKRINTFLLSIAGDFLPDRIFKRILKKRKIKNLYFPSRNKSDNS